MGGDHNRIPPEFPQLVLWLGERTEVWPCLSRILQVTASFGIICQIQLVGSSFLRLDQSFRPPLGLKLWKLAPGTAFDNSKWKSRERAGCAGWGFPRSVADASGFRFPHFVGELQCLGWQRGELINIVIGSVIMRFMNFHVSAFKLNVAFLVRVFFFFCTWA